MKCIIILMLVVELVSLHKTYSETNRDINPILDAYFIYPVIFSSFIFCKDDLLRFDNFVEALDTICPKITVFEIQLVHKVVHAI